RKLFSLDLHTQRKSGQRRFAFTQQRTSRDTMDCTSLVMRHALWSVTAVCRWGASCDGPQAAQDDLTMNFCTANRNALWRFHRSDVAATPRNLRKPAEPPARGKSSVTKSPVTKSSVASRQASRGLHLRLKTDCRLATDDCAAVPVVAIFVLTPPAVGRIIAALS